MELHFELVFNTIHDVDNPHDEDDDGKLKEFRRVIVADDIEMAEKIAEVMLGEEIPGDQRLESVANVRYTSQRCTMGIFSEAKDIWEQVLAKLEIDPNSVTCLHDTQYGGKEIVGFISKN